MNKKLLTGIIILLILASTLAMAAWNPREDIDGKGVYDIYDFFFINGTNIFQDGNKVLDSSDEGDLNVNSSNYWDNLNTPSDLTPSIFLIAGNYLGYTGDTLNVLNQALFDDSTINASQVENFDIAGANDYYYANIVNMSDESITYVDGRSLFLKNDGDTATGNYDFTGNITSSSLDTGQGANELYAMDQPVKTSDSPTFAGGGLTGNLNMNSNSITDANLNGSDVSTGTVDSSYLDNIFETTLTATDFDSGNGAFEINSIADQQGDQDLATTNSPAFAGMTLEDKEVKQYVKTWKYLPQISQINSTNSERITASMDEIFSQAVFGNNTYTNGTAHAQGNDGFRGAALAPNGKVIFAPRDSANVGIYAINQYNGSNEINRKTVLNPLVN